VEAWGQEAMSSKVSLSTSSHEWKSSKLHNILLCLSTFINHIYVVVLVYAMLSMIFDLACTPVSVLQV
jgi:hypothetical protein